MRHPSDPGSPIRTQFDRMEFARTSRAQRALRRFRWVRRLVVAVLLLGIGAAVHATVLPSGRSPLAVSLACLALSVLIEQLARLELSDVLCSEAMALGVSPGTARHYATAFLPRILAEYLERKLPRILVTKLDRERLTRVVREAPFRDENALRGLDAELERAQIVASSEVPPDVVTMNSRVRFEDESGITHEVTLVYPQDADPAQARLSVTTHTGSALLGLQVGQVIDWAFPRGAYRRFRVLAVPYQPEAAGDYHL